MTEPMQRRVRVLLELVVREYTKEELEEERVGTDLEEEDVESDLNQVTTQSIGEAMEAFTDDNEVFAGSGIYLKIDSIKCVEAYDRRSTDT